jgi:hypothetical protein
VAGGSYIECRPLKTRMPESISGLRLVALSSPAAE